MTLGKTQFQRKTQSKITFQPMNIFQIMDWSDLKQKEYLTQVMNMTMSSRKMLLQILVLQFVMWNVTSQRMKFGVNLAVMIELVISRHICSEIKRL
jgi:hypothetical protein